jgi:hypothetical protein
MRQPIEESDKSNLTMAELLTRIQDLENRQPKEGEEDSNRVPMAFLSSSATLSDVISAVNELIKRDLTVSKVK